MTTNEKIARRKLSLLQLAQNLANVSRAGTTCCEPMARVIPLPDAPPACQSME
jgi:hypothetical protein